MRSAGLFAADLASRTGWAYAYPGDEPRSGSHRFAPPAVSVGRFLHEFADWMDAQLMLMQPVCVVYEASIISAGATAHETALKLMGLAGRMEELCDRREIRCISYDSSTVCKWFTGRGRYKDRDTKKAAIIAACRQIGWKPADDDEGDALALWAYGCAQFAPKLRERRPLGALLGAA